MNIMIDCLYKSGIQYQTVCQEQTSMNFFGQQQVVLKFTQQEQLFFKRQLAFLDKDGTNSINMSQAISIVSLSRLPKDTQKLIFASLKLTGKSKLDYTQMKKVLRGVALAQNRISPTSANINGNIKTKMPVFYDQDSQQEAPQSSQQKNSIPTNQKPQIASTPQVVPQAPKAVPSSGPTNFFDQFTPSPANNVKKNAEPAPQTQFRNSIQSVGENKTNKQLDKSFKKFQDFWSTLTTQNGVKISGNQVKKLFGKNKNRQQLAQIWKLCNKTYKGSLSKGELFVFVSIMKSKNGHIPSHLSQEMKQAIRKLDSQNIHKQSTNNLAVSNAPFDFDKSHQFDRSEHVQKTSQAKNVQKKYSGENRQRASTSVSDFDDFANFANPHSRQTPKAMNKSQSQQYAANTSNNFSRQQIRQPEKTVVKQQVIHSKTQTNQPPPVVKIQAQPTIIPVNQAQPSTFPVIQPIIQIVQSPNQLNQLPINLVDSAQSTVIRQLQMLVNQMAPQLQYLSNQNKQASVKLQQTNQFLNNIDQAHQFFANKINQLKVAQDDTNHRLNQTCIRMRDIIFKQSQLINSIVTQFEGQIQFGKGRVNVLQNYTTQKQQQLNAAKTRYDKSRFNNNNNNIQQNNVQAPAKINQNPHLQNNEPTIRNQRASIGNRSSIGSNQHPSENTTQIYNKKSMQSMREMTQSMAVRKTSKKQTEQSAIQIESGGIYRQKLMQQLRQQQKLHENQNMMESTKNPTIQTPTTKNEDGYHWSIGQRHQIPNQAGMNMKKTDSEQSQEDDQLQKQRIQAQKQIILKHQQKLMQQQKQAQMHQSQIQQAQVQQVQTQQVQMQQPGQGQVQQQAQMQAQQQAQMQAQIQAQQLAIQKALQNASPELKSKQMLLVQMLNFLQPIKPQNYLTVVSKVVSLSQAQIDSLYAIYYKQYLQKVQNEQNKVKASGTQANILQMPNEDQFRTNSFKNTSAQQQANSTTFF